MEWRVCETDGNGRTYWNVYKLKSVCAPDEEGNRVYCRDCFDTEKDAKKYAALLNNPNNYFKHQETYNAMQRTAYANGTRKSRTNTKRRKQHDR